MKINKISLLLCTAVMAVSGCSSDMSEEASPAGADSQVQSEPVADAGISSDPVDATAVAEDLKSASGTATTIETITEDNDPNDKIGRPNGYESAAVIYDSEVSCDSLGVDCGLTIEVYPDETGAIARAEYLQTIQRSMPLLGSEWDYVKGGVLVRISGNLKPSSATKYSDQFDGSQVLAPAE